MPKITPKLADYRFDSALKHRARFDLTRVDPAAQPFGSGDKARDRAETLALAVELDQLQNLFYADRRYRLLVVLQGTDTSGKDGTIRGVFGQMSPLGVHTVAWKAPTEPERAHDYLWRIHRQMPANGEVVIFNRSHYEDVLVPRIQGVITAGEVEARYAQINDFERMLSENGTVIVKFMLHLSKEEQRIRLQERLDDPDKHWKFAVEDLEAREHWDDYQRAYNDAIAATGTPWAPWNIVPADSKTHRNLMIATVMKHVFTALALRYPPSDPALVGLKVI